MNLKLLFKRAGEGIALERKIEKSSAVA